MHKLKPKGDQTKGHQKSMGGGKLVVRQKSRHRHMSDLQSEDRKMVNYFYLWFPNVAAIS